MLKTIELPLDVKYEQIDGCDLCNSKRIKEWDKSRSNTLYRCNDCSLVFTNPRISDVHQKDKYLYTKNYFTRSSRMKSKMLNARKASYESELSVLGQYVSGGEILDVGCGTGNFLDVLGTGWQKSGCDVSSYALLEAKQKGIKTYKGQFEDLEFSDQRFDAIYFRASLHHSYRPALCIKKAYELLNDNGIIAICMSNNIEGISGKLFKSKVKSYEQPHNFIFGLSTLKKYLRDNNFKYLNHYFPYWGSGYHSLFDFPNLLYLYFKYLLLKITKSANKAKNYDFSSPPFYGNYINIYGQKCE